MKWLSRFTRAATMLLRYRVELKELVLDSVRVWDKYSEANMDGKIDADEYAAIASRAIIAGGRARYIALLMGWIK